MLELKLEVSHKHTKFPDEIKRVFPYRLVFYTMNMECLYLNTYVIVDFQNDKISYLKTLFPENIDALTKYDDSLLDKIPHTTFDMGNDQFLSFLYTVFRHEGAFRKIDLNNKKFYVLRGEDLPHPEGKELQAVCDEPCKDENNNIYLAFIKHPGETTTYFKCSQDLSKVEKIFENKILASKPPHHLILYNNDIISTGYNHRVIDILRNGEYIGTGEDKTIENIIKKDLKSRFKIGKLIDDFDNWYKEQSFYNILKKYGYKLVTKQGEIVKFNLNTGKLDTFDCTFNPSHIEIDTEKDILYIMSNNISVYKGMFFYITTAHIDKMSLDGKLIESYTNNNMWRCTTHKFFKNRGRKFLCTFGHPNRLVFLEECGDKIKEHYYHDMYKKILPEGDRAEFLNAKYVSGYDDPNRYQAMQPSTDGKYIITFSQEHIIFFDFEERKIAYEIPYELDDGFFQLSHHSCFLK